MSVDEILNNIPQTETKEKTVTEITVIKKAPTQKSINAILLIAASFIFLAVIASYFVDLNIFTDITLKELSTGAIWIFIGSFSIASIFKQISINRAKQTQEYIDQKEKTKKTLKEHADAGDLDKASEYCRHWEAKTLISDRERYLIPVGISYEVFLKKYLAKSFFKLKKECPELSFKQRIAIMQANNVRVQRYDADFLRTTVHTTIHKSPSKRFDTERRDFWYTIRMVVSMILGSFFAYSIAHDLVVSFSTSALIEAGIKIAIIIISVAFATSFGWQLITVTEVNRLQLQEAEAEECAKFSQSLVKGEKNGDIN